MTYHNHTATSIAAAESIAPILPKLEAEVLGLLVQCGPMTDEELTRRLGWNPSTARPRRIRLCQLGLVEDSTMRRPGISGRAMICWRAKRSHELQRVEQMRRETVGA